MAAKNYTIEQRTELNEKLKPYLEKYYINNGKKLEKLVNKILTKLKFFDVATDEFVSLANEIIANSMYDYDFKQNFDGYIYRCLENKFKTEMTRRNRIKRTADRNSISWETPIEDENGQTIGELISDTKIAVHFDIDKTFFEDDGEKYSEKMLKYIKTLSVLQKEVVKLIISGYAPLEIREILHITQKEYNDCLESMASYKNISIFFYN